MDLLHHQPLDLHHALARTQAPHAAAPNHHRSDTESLGCSCHCKHVWFTRYPHCMLLVRHGRGGVGHHTTIRWMYVFIHVLDDLCASPTYSPHTTHSGLVQHPSPHQPALGSAEAHAVCEGCAAQHQTHIRSTHANSHGGCMGGGEQCALQVCYLIRGVVEWYMWLSVLRRCILFCSANIMLLCITLCCTTVHHTLAYHSASYQQPNMYKTTGHLCAAWHQGGHQYWQRCRCTCSSQHEYIF